MSLAVSLAVSRPSRTRHAASRRRWILAAAAGTLYATALLATLSTLHARRLPRSAAPLPGASIAAALPTFTHHPRRAGAYLVARAADCSGNFEFLDLFERPPVREKLDLVGVVALGDTTAAATLERALATHGHDLPVRPATPALRSALASLGLRATPYLLVLDRDGALRFAIGAPESVRQYLTLGVALPLLADPDPPPDAP